MKFSNTTGSPSTNAMFGIETPMGRTPFQGASLDVGSPRAKEAPGLFCETATRSLEFGHFGRAKAGEIRRFSLGRNFLLVSKGRYV